MTRCVVVKLGVFIVVACVALGALGCSAAEIEDSRRALGTREAAAEVDKLGYAPGTAELGACAGTLTTTARGELLLKSAQRTRTLTSRLVEAPVSNVSRGVVVWVQDAATAGATLIRSVACVAGAWGRVRTLVDDGRRQNRLAVSPNGRRVAYVSTSDAGLASVFVVDMSGGAPTQLTNIGLRRVPGRAPVGFVPPPQAKSASV